jgi:dsDNA-binding SOS-regulon protein
MNKHEHCNLCSPVSLQGEQYEVLSVFLRPNTDAMLFWYEFLSRDTKDIPDEWSDSQSNFTILTNETIIVKVLLES